MDINTGVFHMAEEARRDLLEKLNSWTRWPESSIPGSSGLEHNLSHPGRVKKLAKPPNGKEQPLSAYQKTNDIRSVIETMIKETPFPE
ncbi:MAG: hypothetical protein CMI18_08525 [Opitutaceae bacterium]|nr:hypothetical protein [Opitutaceae bacterium]|tara:strand:+ start:296 stop:559 length:264 start_codon:yes stop_codon:yes gene_type:complete